MSFRLVPKWVTLNDLKRRNGVILRYFSEFGYIASMGALRKSLHSLSHLLMSSCIFVLWFLCSSLWLPCVADADIIFSSCFFFLLVGFFLA